MLTRKSLEILIDLVEIKLGSMEVCDKEDRRAIGELEACRKALAAMQGVPRACEATPSAFASA